MIFKRPNPKIISVNMYTPHIIIIGNIFINEEKDSKSILGSIDVSFINKELEYLYKYPMLKNIIVSEPIRHSSTSVLTEGAYPKYEMPKK